MKRKIGPPVRAPKSHGLREFFLGIYLPQLRRGGASSSYVEIHRSAIEHLERFCKRQLAVPEIDGDLLLGFDAWLWQRGASDNRRRNLVESLNRICWAFSPGDPMFAKRCARRILPEPAPGTARHFYSQVYAKECMVGRTHRHVEESGTVFRRLLSHYGRDIELAELSDRLAAEFFDALLRDRLKPATVNSGYRAVLFAVWREAYRRGLVERLPTFRKLPETSEEADSWSAAEMSQIVSCTWASTPDAIAGCKPGDWWAAFLLVAWYTALRRRALFALMPADVDLQSGWMTSFGANMKNRRGQSFRLGDDAIAAVHKIWDPKRERLFPWPYGASCFHVQFRRIREAAEVSKGRCHLAALHKVRRSSATAVAEKHGMRAAQDLLGHSSPRMTERYVDPRRLIEHDFSATLRQLQSLVPDTSSTA